MRPLNIFASISVDVSDCCPTRISMRDVEEIWFAVTKKRIGFFNRIFWWMIVNWMTADLEERVKRLNIPRKYGVRSLCLLFALVNSVWSKVGQKDVSAVILTMACKRKYTVEDEGWWTLFAKHGGLVFDDTWRKALIVLGTFDEYDAKVCAIVSEFVGRYDQDKYHPVIRASVKLVANLLKLDLAGIGRGAFSNLDGIAKVMMRLASKYDFPRAVEQWAIVEQKRERVLAALSGECPARDIAEEIDVLIDCVNQAGAATFAAIYFQRHRRGLMPELDFLRQANALLIGGDEKEGSYVSAAVLIGVTLEKSLRAMCEKAIPRIPTVLDNGRSKMMGRMINDLKMAAAINEVQFRQLESWNAIRNAAAHGMTDQISKNDVLVMLQGVRGFLGERQ